MSPEDRILQHLDEIESSQEDESDEATASQFRLDCEIAILQLGKDAARDIFQSITDGWEHGAN